MDKKLVRAPRTRSQKLAPTAIALPASEQNLSALGAPTVQTDTVGSEAPAAPVIREQVLRDPRYPIHRIADRFLPYLRVLVEQFHPQRVILFGSYAYGKPDRDSDVDLLIIKEVGTSALQEKIKIRKAWRKMPRQDPLLAFDLILVSPQRHQERLSRAAGFYDEIVHKGLVLV